MDYQMKSAKESRKINKWGDEEALRKIIIAEQRTHVANVFWKQALSDQTYCVNESFPRINRSLCKNFSRDKNIPRETLSD